MKHLNLKIALFAFFSAIVCIVGYHFLQAEALMMIKDALFLVAYVCFFVWISQLIYDKVRFGITLTIVILTLTLAIYLGVYMNFTRYEFLVEYCYYAFYILTVACIISVIAFIGMLIFRPRSSGSSSASESQQVGETDQDKQ